LSLASQKLKIKGLEIQNLAYQILKLLGFENSTFGFPNIENSKFGN